MPRQDAECRASGCHTLSPLHQQGKEFLEASLGQRIRFSSFSQSCCPSCQLLVYQISLLGVLFF